MSTQRDNTDNESRQESPDTDKAVDFLWKLPTEKIHVCAIHPTRPGLIRGRTFERTVDRAGVARWLAVAQKKGFGCYFYINDLSVILGPDKPKALEADVTRLNALHIDGDVPKSTRPENMAGAKAELLAKARAHRRAPSIIVDSGGGFGFFAKLKTSVLVTEDNRDSLKLRNKQYSLDICGPDADACWNLDRVMRLPFTINYPNAAKIERGRTAVLATLVEDASQRLQYDVTEFPPAATDQAGTGEYIEFGDPSDATIDSLDLAEKLAVLIRTGDHGDTERTRDRSKGAFYIMCELIRAEVSNEDILALAINPDYVGFAHLHDPQRATRGPLETAERMLREALTREPRSSRAMSADDLYAYLPEHAYIYVPTRTLWPAATVNSLLGKGASVYLDRTKAVQQMTWAPGLPMLIKNRLVVEGGWTDKESAMCFNLYMAPANNARGDATQAGPWLDHLRKVYPEDASHIEQWFGWRVQRPDVKINHSLVLGSSQHGIGKDTLLEPVKYAVGPWNFKDVSAEQVLNPNYNAFLKSVILRISEARDLGDKDRFAFYDHTKTWMASPPDVLSVADKYIRAHPVFNCTGIVITTNHKTDGLYLPPEDRRHYVAWTDIEPQAFNADYWKRLWAWYGDGGVEHVAAYLSDLDVSTFDPKAPPPKTPAFWEIVNVGRSSEDAELADIFDRLADPFDSGLIERPVAVTVEDIALEASRDQDRGFYHWITDRKNRPRIPHRMEQCGYAPIRNPDAKDGLWAIAGRRQVIYGLTVSSLQNRLRAAAALVDAAQQRVAKMRRGR
jgi:hypothetical protein